MYRPCTLLCISHTLTGEAIVYPSLLYINLPSSVSSDVIRSSKSVPSPRRFRLIISRFSSKTEIPVPSNVTREGSFCDLNRKNTEEDMMQISLSNAESLIETFPNIPN